MTEAFAMPAVALIGIGLIAQFMLERRPLEGLYDVSDRAGWCREIAVAPAIAPIGSGENS